ADLRAQLLRDPVHGEASALLRVGLGHDAVVEPQRALEQSERRGEDHEADRGRDQHLHEREALLGAEAAHGVESAAVSPHFALVDVSASVCAGMPLVALTFTFTVARRAALLRYAHSV